MSSKGQQDDDTHSIPIKVKSIINNYYNNGVNVNIILAQASDIKLNGFFGVSWLIATEEHVLIVEPDSNKIVLAISLRDLEEIQVRHLYGNGVVEVKTKNRTVDLLRFSRSYADKMESTARELSRLVREICGYDIKMNISEESGEQTSINRCMNCGKSIPFDMRICPKCIQKRKTLSRLLIYVKPYTSLAVAALLLAITGTVIQMVPQYLTKIMVDDVILNQRSELLVWVVFALLLVYGSSSLIGGIRGYLTNKLGHNVLFDLRTNLYEHLQRLSISFFDQRQTGAIMARVIGDVNRLRNFLSNGLQDVIIQFFTIIVICIMLFATNARLALIALLPVPIVLIATIYFNKYIRKVWHRIHRRSSELNAILGDTLPGIRVVKAFGREKNEVEKFRNKHSEYYDAAMLASKMNNRFYPALSFVIAIGIIAIWGLGGKEVIHGIQYPDELTITLGDLVLFTGLLGQLYGPIQRLSHLSGMLQESATSAERIFEIMDNQPERPDADQPQVLTDIKGDIVFESVSFEYEKGEKVLDNINLHIHPGEMIGLVGASGSGKTTLINLLSRFYPVDQGSIRIDGIDINDVEIKSLRDQMAVVLQEPFLFHATIRENIAYGKHNATQEDIIWAAKMANAHEFISKFPDGYDTVLGERGTGLSGGQKQRISIARAILRQPRILILDEATSAVDTVTETLIQTAIDNLVKDRTTIAIAHRLSTLKNADKIVVMDKGRIVEQGTHEELMELGGMFAKLVEMQSHFSRKSINEMIEEVS